MTFHKDPDKATYIFQYNIFGNRYIRRLLLYIVLSQTLFSSKNLNRVIAMYCINICLNCTVIEVPGIIYHWLDSSGV